VLIIAMLDQIDNTVDNDGVDVNAYLLVHSPLASNRQPKEW